MKRLINFLKTEKRFAFCFFTSLVVAVIATICVAFCLEATTFIEIAKSILYGTTLGVVIFGMLASLSS